MQKKKLHVSAQFAGDDSLIPVLSPVEALTYRPALAKFFDRMGPLLELAFNEDGVDKIPPWPGVWVHLDSEEKGTTELGVLIAPPPGNNTDMLRSMVEKLGKAIAGAKDGDKKAIGLLSVIVKKGEEVGPSAFHVPKKFEFNFDEPYFTFFIGAARMFHSKISRKNEALELQLMSREERLIWKVTGTIHALRKQGKRRLAEHLAHEHAKEIASRKTDIYGLMKDCLACTFHFPERTLSVMIEVQKDDPTKLDISSWATNYDDIYLGTHEDNEGDDDDE